MRPLSRLRPSIEAILTANPSAHPLPYVCRSCRVGAVAPRRRHASISSLLNKAKTPNGTTTDIKERAVQEGDEDAFVPASTWEGLEWIGTPEWQAKQNVVEGHNFDSFAGRERVADLPQIKLCVKGALVKVIRARNKELNAFHGPAFEEPTVDNISHLEGSWGSGWRVTDTKQQSGWRNIDLSDVDFRFAVVKRLASISGIVLADPAIMRITSAYKLLDAAEVLPKPKKLITRNPAREDELVIRGQTTGYKNNNVKPKLNTSLLNLPNVKVSERRISREDQEKQIGRWKVIEEELERKRLPLSPASFKYGV